MKLKRGLCFFVFLLSGLIHAQNYIIYQVQPEDTPQSIALENAISVDELYRFNPDLKNVKSLDRQKIVIPKSKNSDLSFVRYRVKTKETLYSISRTYNVSIEDLKAFNPQLYEKELQAGEVIRIPAYKLPEKYQDVDFNESIKNSNFSAFKHIVLPNEKKSDIVQKYGISAKDFDSLNEGIIEVQSGQLVKIVKSEKDSDKLDIETLDMALQFYKVPKKQTLYSLSKEFKISEDIIYRLNPIVRIDGLKEGTVIKLPEKIESLNQAEKIVNLESRVQNLNDKNLALLLPFSLQKFKGDSINVEQIILKDNSNPAPLINISLDFYEGVKLAIKKAKSLGIYTDLKVYDTKRNPKVMDSILMFNSFSDRDAIIGPIINPNILKLTEELKTTQIPIFLPITKLENPPSYVFNTIPPSSSQTETLITLIDSIRTENQNLVFVTDSTSTEKYEKYKYSFPKGKFVKIKKTYVESADIEEHLEKEKENWVVLETDQIGISESVVKLLNRYNEGYVKTNPEEEDEEKVRQPKPEDSIQYDVRLWTSDRNKAFYSVVDNKALSNLEFTYTAISKYDILEHSSIIEDYIRNNGHVPTRYTLRAFDLTYDILLRLAYEGTLKSEEALSPLTEYNENRFGYRKSFMSSNYENIGLFIIHFKPDFEVEILNSSKN
jgi:LysM repeat protein